jgi:transcriptional regulator with XRE-family HTH domain
MNFAEKLKKARENAGITQMKLAEQSGVALRTIQNWENDLRRPSKIETVQKVATVLGVDATDLLSDSETFVLKAGEEYGSRGKKGAEKLLNEISGLFAGGEMAEADKDEFMLAIQEAYVLAKQKNKRFTPKKYLKDEDK